ncbi:SIR2 family protein [Fulvivirga ligni]|uniref:SIR2 family protein n=1 Tax=Fulvivirga ligni TaxID=2904246 RepID=UPI001F290ADD|nr:SIR2 family protein [Fulvivirga ligni]UII20472.1 SIR2 family protein [Fulvivirga ligni]
MDFKEHPNYKSFSSLYTNNPDRVIFFCGEGLSQPLFPSWKTLLSKMVDELDKRGKLTFEKAELDEKIDKGDSYLEIADYCAETLGKSDYRELLEEVFDKTFEVDEIPKAYSKILSIPSRSILTTNYDRIPEVGSRGKYNTYHNLNISEGLKALEKGKKIVLKVHGDITSHNSIVLTREDYKEIIHKNPSISTGLKSIFTSYTVCFIGFSLNDPHFDLVMEFLNSVNNGLNVVHYSFMENTSAFDIRNKERRLGIRIIPYTPSDKSHPEVLDFINSLNSNQPSEVKQEIRPSDISSFVATQFEKELNLFSYNVRFQKDTSTLTIDYFTRANTEYENQREIISILKQSYVQSELINHIVLNCFIKTNAVTEYVKYSPIIISVRCSYKSLKKLILSEISENNFWKELLFHQPFAIGNIHHVSRKVNFPLINLK